MMLLAFRIHRYLGREKDLSSRRNLRPSASTASCWCTRGAGAHVGGFPWIHNGASGVSVQWQYAGIGTVNPLREAASWSPHVGAGSCRVAVLYQTEHVVSCRVLPRDKPSRPALTDGSATPVRGPQRFAAGFGDVNASWMAWPTLLLHTNTMAAFRWPEDGRVRPLADSSRNFVLQPRAPAGNARPCFGHQPRRAKSLCRPHSTKHPHAHEAPRRTVGPHRTWARSGGGTWPSN